jgi:hypothetical protein
LPDSIVACDDKLINGDENETVSATRTRRASKSNFSLNPVASLAALVHRSRGAG